MTNDQFRPVVISEYYRDRVAKGLRDNIWETMFKPVFDILRSDNTVINAKSALNAALESGRVYYENGAFRAVKTFSNEVSKELEGLGAKFKYGAYYIDRALLPLQIENTLAMIAARNSAKIAALNTLLFKLANDINKKEFNRLVIEEAAQLMFKKLEKDLIESTSEGKLPTVGTYYEVPDLEISDTKINELNQFYEQGGGSNAPEIDLEEDVAEVKPQKGSGGAGPKDDNNSDTVDYKGSLDAFKEDKWTKKIAKDYVYNMNYWVKKWKAKEIIKMRRDVLEMVQSGARIETIQEYFEKEWKIAKDKAAFLARNESEIASSVIKAVHYQRQGCTHFFWLKSVSKEKRELHLEYAQKHNNKHGVGGTNIFPYDNPPIIDERTGQRGLPGQTYNCRCNQLGVKNYQYWVNRRKIENAKRNIFTKIKYNIQNSLQRNNYPWRYRRFGEGEAV